MTNVDPITQLIRLRNKHGAASPIGSRCSIGVNTLEALKTEPSERHAILRGSLAATLSEIQQLVAGAPSDVQVRRAPQPTTRTP